MAQTGPSYPSAHGESMPPSQESGNWHMYGVGRGYGYFTEFSSNAGMAAMRFSINS